MSSSEDLRMQEAWQADGRVSPTPGAILGGIIIHNFIL